ncbi:DUF305 domain-containing protein [Microbacterium sp. C5A9]|jgi:uncharacterized protein (DUF305 family)|uniref:DUF305 domain-containing protein n=1 Tax=Microbacterium TaxID=33882 RepID=UPI0007F453D2|nr:MULTISPECIES: DUF305 domain-containing protein [Microbacterium]MCI1019736.1 DUF305 domain-containing protein [Microbacterium sp. C5A9]OAN37317.1 DUF305 domain-containing protein [Microbacterium sp. H83]PCE15522.1 DUF305 domain-containing protein [Microbacterium sp. SZ1]
MKTRFAATAALTLAAVLGLAGCAGNTSGGGDMPGMNHESSSSAPASADANDADIMFASMMKEHHAQAIDMSDMLLSKEGVDERVVALAEEIKAAQEPEIQKMDQWLEEWGADTSDMEGMDHGGGMMSEEDMQALEDATGADASRLFLEQMIQHHEGAVEMAQEEVDNGQNSDAIALAETIIEAQTTEIATMKDLLDTL